MAEKLVPLLESRAAAALAGYHQRHKAQIAFKAKKAAGMLNRTYSGL
jgi:hypothetical protein